MKKFSKILCFLLACVMLLPMAIACKKEEEIASEETTAESAGVDESVATVEEIFQMTGLEERDINGKMFSIRYSTEGTWAPAPIDVEKLAAQKDTVSKAGYDRDRYFEELTGAELSYTAVKTNPNDFYGSNSEVTSIRNLIASGDISDFNMLMVGARPAGQLVMEQAFTDLNEYDNIIHNQNDYYNANLNKQLSLGGKQLMVAGYYTTGNIKGLGAICVNNDVFSNNNSSSSIDELYQLAIDHKWTLEKLLEYGKNFAVDKDKENENLYTLSLSINLAEGFYYVLGGALVEKNVQDVPEVTVSKYQDVLTYINQKISGNYAVCIAPSDQGQVDVYQNNQAMFGYNILGALGAAKNSAGIDERLMPLPLYEEGDEYRALLPSWNANVAAIPAHAADIEFSAYCMELYMAMSYQYIYPEYYEKLCLLRAVDNATESKIYDMIVKNTYIDLATCYAFLDENDISVRRMITKVGDRPKLEIGSTVETLDSSLNSKLTDFFEKYKF